MAGSNQWGSSSEVELALAVAGGAGRSRKINSLASLQRPRGLGALFILRGQSSIGGGGGATSSCSSRRTTPRRWRCASSSSPTSGCSTRTSSAGGWPSAMEGLVRERGRTCAGDGSDWVSRERLAGPACVGGRGRGSGAGGAPHARSTRGAPHRAGRALRRRARRRFPRRRGAIDGGDKAIRHRSKLTQRLP